MAHIPYADLNEPATQPLAARIIAERGSVLHLYQMLLHSPPLAEGWLGFMTQVRQKLDLPGDLRELVIMRVAVLNGAPYEAEQHAPFALREGLSQAQLNVLAEWQGSTHFSPLQRAVLLLCDTMTQTIKVPAEILGPVRAGLGERQTVELVATIAAYNMVSRFLEALNIHGSDGRP